MDWNWWAMANAARRTLVEKFGFSYIRDRRAVDLSCSKWAIDSAATTFNRHLIDGIGQLE